jgi:DivIVA domain-containing protein
VVNLTPNDIERRTFSLEERGYNRDEVRKFLFEVAARLRLAFHTTQPPVSYRSARPEDRDEPTTGAATTGAPERADDPADGAVAADPSDRSELGSEPRDRSGDDLANPLGDPLAALAGVSDLVGTFTPAGDGEVDEIDPLDRFARLERIDPSSIERTRRANPASGNGSAAHDPAPDGSRGSDAPAASSSDGSDDGYERLGSEVADVLRAAHDIVEARRAQAEADAATIRAEAENDATELRRQADAEAAWQLDRAKRVLIAAQEQAEAIIAEAEAQAKAMITGARDQAEQHTQHVAAQARLHAETILRAEREALDRLHEANAGVRAAIEKIGAGESRPVVDLTEFRPHVHLGEVSVEMHAEPAMTDDHAAQDPLVRMMRHAVDRAVDGAAEHANDESDDAADAPAPSSGRTLDPLPDTPASV